MEGLKALTLRRSNGRPLPPRSRSDQLRTQMQGQGSSNGGGVGPRKNSPLCCRLSAAHSPQNILGRGYWEQRGSTGSWSGGQPLAEATSHPGSEGQTLRGTCGDSPQISSAPGSVGLGPSPEGQKGKD